MDFVLGQFKYQSKPAESAFPGKVLAATQLGEQMELDVDFRPQQRPTINEKLSWRDVTRHITIKVVLPL